MNYARGMKFSVPLTLVVIVSSLILLNSRHDEVPFGTRILITIGGGIVTFVITFYLFGIKDKINEDE